MQLLIRFESDDWRSYAADLAADPKAWREANPDAVEMGPFDEVSVERGRVMAVRDGEVQEVAHHERDEPWRLKDRDRPYDQLKIVMKAATDFTA